MKDESDGPWQDSGQSADLEPTGRSSDMCAPLHFHSMPVWGLFAMGTLKARIDFSAQECAPEFFFYSGLAVPPASH